MSSIFSPRLGRAERRAEAENRRGARLEKAITLTADDAMNLRREQPQLAGEIDRAFEEVHARFADALIKSNQDHATSP